jgi:hypothetical protein
MTPGSVHSRLRQVQQIDSVDTGHAQIQEHHVNGGAFECFQGFFTGMGSSSEPHADLSPKQRRQPGANNRMIVNDENSNRCFRFWRVHHRSSSFESTIDTKARGGRMAAMEPARGLRFLSLVRCQL